MLFKEINEAYEVLSDNEQRYRYDEMLRGPLSSPWSESYQSQPSRARSARFSERARAMQGVLPYVRLLFYFGCFWSLVLVIDYMLPHRVLRENVTTEIRQVTQTLMRHPRDLLVTENGHHFPVLLSEMRYFPRNTELRIHTSAIFSALVKLENYNGSFEVNNLGTIYRNFSFAPILLLLCCMVGIIFRKGIEFHVNLGIVVFLLVILNFVFLYKSVL